MDKLSLSFPLLRVNVVRVTPSDVPAEYYVMCSHKRDSEKLMRLSGFGTNKHKRKYYFYPSTEYGSSQTFSFLYKNTWKDKVANIPAIIFFEVEKDANATHFLKPPFKLHMPWKLVLYVVDYVLLQSDFLFQKIFGNHLPAALVQLMYPVRHSASVGMRISVHSPFMLYQCNVM